MRIAMFDQMENPGVSLGEFYRNHLKMIQTADSAGFWCYFKSEHHVSPLDVAPSTNVWLTVVAHATTSIRIGSLVYLLPFHHPLRLVEEVAILDHLSGGRVEMGVGRGIAPPEHQMWHLDAAKARQTYTESLVVMRAAMALEGDDRLSLDTANWSFDHVPIEIRPLQRPHPPIWYPGNLAHAAEMGFNTVVGGSAEVAPSAVAAFRKMRAESVVRLDVEPSIGGAIRVYLAENEADAVATARRSWTPFAARISRVFAEAGITELPNDPAAGGDFDAAVGRGLVLAGTPQQLSDRLRQLAAAGIDPAILNFSWGDLSHDEVMGSLRLFIEAVMPAAVRFGEAA